MGKSPLSYFIKHFTLLGLVILLLTSGLVGFLEPDTFKVVLSSLIFNWLMTLISGLVLGYTFTRTHAFFMGALVGGMLVKLIVSPIYIYVMDQLFPDVLAVTTSAFLLYYMLFTGFEVYQLIRNLRPHLKKDTEN
jgi:hypothetical protein